MPTIKILLQKSAMDGFRRLARTCLVEPPPIRCAETVNAATALPETSRHSRHAERWRPADELGQPTKVLRDRCQGELELSATRPAQSQPTKPQNALEMSKQHLNAFSVMARSFECFGLGHLASNVTSLLVDAALAPCGMAPLGNIAPSTGSCGSGAC